MRRRRVRSLTAGLVAPVNAGVVSVLGAMSVVYETCPRVWQGVLQHALTTPVGTLVRQNTLALGVTAASVPLYRPAMVGSLRLDPTCVLHPSCAQHTLRARAERESIEAQRSFMSWRPPQASCPMRPPPSTAHKKGIAQRRLTAGKVPGGKGAPRRRQRTAA